MIDREKICFICATLKGDYCFDGIKQMGYRIMIPYRDHNLLLRCMREVWFRLGLPAKHFWYNPQCKRAEADLFIVRDSLMSAEYLAWLRKCHPNARIILEYDNMARTTINPDSVTDPSIEKWTYDYGDAERHNMRLKAGGYYDKWVCPKAETPMYDVVYVGRDKGRAEELLAFERKLQRLGLKTYFHICPDRRFMRWKKSYYKKLLNYREYLELLGTTKAVLNIVQEGAVSITMREVEAAIHDFKCITNNPIIRECDLYDPSRYFILGEQPLEDLPVFMEMPLTKVPKDLLYNESYDRSVEKYLAEDPRDM